MKTNELQSKEYAAVGPCVASDDREEDRTELFTGHLLTCQILFKHHPVESE